MLGVGLVMLRVGVGVGLMLVFVLVIGLIIKLLLVLVLVLPFEGCIPLVGTASLCCQNGFLVGCIPGFIVPVWFISTGAGIVLVTCVCGRWLLYWGCGYVYVFAVGVP